MADDIAQWLDGLGLGQYARAFAENGIDFDVVPRLTDDILKELGFNLGDRLRLQSAMEEMAGDQTSIRSAAPEPQPAEAERRQLTVMFCDLVGSTALSTELDPDDMRDVLRAYQDVCADVIARYDGFVAKYMGDGVLAYFGYPTAHEDDAERAMNSGLGIVKAVTGLERDLAVRVGIATGTVAVGDIIGEGASEEAAIIGEAPNLAARLQGIAEPGQVVIGETTHRLAGALFECRALGARDLKGFAEPVPAWAALAALTSESRFEARRVGGLTELVGREEEIGILERRWRRAEAGDGQVVLISGEPGIGKSRLVSALEDRVAGDGATRLRYQCSPYHANSALFPVIGQLERAGRLEAGEADAAKIEKLEALLALSGGRSSETVSLFADLLSISIGDRYPILDVTPERRKSLLLAAIVDRLLGLAERKPVLFVFEDIHWIDPTSRELLDQAVDAIGDARVLMVITHRPEHVSPWVGRAGVSVLSLNRLGRQECAAMAAKVTGGAALPEDVLDQIVARTDGVPLFVEELTKSVLERDEGLESSIPTTLHDLLEARLDRLGKAKEIAQIGAAIGREFDHRLISEVAPVSAAALEHGLDQLVASELVFRRGAPPDARYSFKHALVRDAAYASLLRRRRRELHLGIADCLEARFPATAEAQPELMAHHLSGAGETMRALAAWKRAGERSAEASANIEAISHFEHALELIESSPENNERDQLELELRIALGGPLLMTRGHGASEVGSNYTRTRELCRKIGDPPQIVPALFGMWRFYIGRGDCTITRDLGRQLLELATSSNDVPAIVLGHYGLGFALFCHGDLKEARAHLEDGYARYDRQLRDNLAFRLGQDPGVACLSYCALALWVLGYPEQAKRTTRKALALAEELSHPFSSAYALSLACQVLQLRGEVEEVREASEAAIAISREQGFAVWIASPTIFRGWARSRQDDSIHGAQEAAAGLTAIIDAGMEMRRPYYLALVAECYISAGRFAEAGGTIDEALAIIAKTDEHWSEAELLRVSGELSARDDVAAAEAKFHQALTVARGLDAKSWELRSATSLARLWHSQGKTTEARDLLAPIHGWFTEGFDTADLRKAKALLDKLT